jgi:hypothetical protein
MTYHKVCNKSNTTGVTCAAETASSAIGNYSLNSRSVALSRKVNLKIDIKHVF